MKSNKQAKREAKRLFHLCLVNGLMDDNRARQVVGTAMAAPRRDSRRILTQFLRLVRLDGARHTASIESAAPLPPDLRTVIVSGLTKRYGAGLTTTFVQRPSLIGGVRIQVGSDVYDSSVSAALAKLETSF